MAYQDPYAGQYGHSQYAQQPYGQPQQQQQHYYNDQADYNPYAPQQGGYNTNRNEYYEPYQDTPAPPQHYRDASGSQQVPAPVAPPKSVDETSAFDHGEFSPSPRGPKTASALRQYRRDFQGNLWTGGGRGSCFLRFFCCTFLILVFLVATILLTLILWLRPPGVDLGQFTPNTSAIKFDGDTITIGMGVNISVQNPNYFKVNFKKISADIWYPLNGNLTGIGNGTKSDIVIESNDRTNFTFPFTFAYSTAIDPGNHILLDIAEHCGLIGAASDIKIQYTITLGIQIFFVTISPKISNSFSLPCPLNPSELEAFLKSLGLGTLAAAVL